MNNVNKTMYIPLYGKAFVSRKGIILSDEKAEYIWEKEGFRLKGKSKSKWLAYFMGMRSAVFDRWLSDKLSDNSDAAVLHIGCGMDSRIVRVGCRENLWFDIDFPEVISERKKYYEETGNYRMISADARNPVFLSEIPCSKAIVVLEGVCMYFEPADLRNLLAALCGHFESISILMDCYTSKAAKASKFKNPINDVGVTKVYGIDNPDELTSDSLLFVKEHNMTPDELIDELHGAEKSFFRSMFAGKLARSLYRIYEYKSRS